MELSAKMFRGHKRLQRKAARKGKYRHPVYNIFRTGRRRASGKSPSFMDVSISGFFLNGGTLFKIVLARRERLYDPVEFQFPVTSSHGDVFRPDRSPCILSFFLGGRFFPDEGDFFYPPFTGFEEDRVGPDDRQVPGSGIRIGTGGFPGSFIFFSLFFRLPGDAQGSFPLAAVFCASSVLKGE